MKIFRIAVLGILIGGGLFSTANACPVESNIEIEVEDVPPIPLYNSEIVTANITFRWDFGLAVLFPQVVNIWLEAINVPNWLSVIPSKKLFTIGAGLPIFHREFQWSVFIDLVAGKEIEAFVPSTFILRAYTNGSRFVKGSEDKKEISVMEDFYYKGINASISSSRIKVAERKEKKISLHLGNICNGDVMVELGAQTPKGWKITFGDSKFVIHSKFSNNEKDVEIKIDNEKGKGTGEGKIVVSYYPKDNPELGKEEIYIPLRLEEKEGKGGVTGITAFVIGIVVLILLIGIWKKKGKKF